MTEILDDGEAGPSPSAGPADPVRAAWLALLRLLAEAVLRRIAEGEGAASGQRPPTDPSPPSA